MTGQNTSTAVMQRRVEPDDSLDDFPTQPWATRALIEHVIAPQYERSLDIRGLPHIASCSVWEPTCNRGYMARPLAEYFGEVWTSDVHNYGWPGQQAVEDFLFPGVDRLGTDWAIFNPPFRLASEFILKALDIAGEGVAAIVRTAFLEGVGRYRELFGRRPPTIVAQFTERVPMVKGRVTATGSTATAYCWVVWMPGDEGTQFRWIPPCRKKLERPGDYT